MKGAPAQAALELAVSVPLLLIVLVGIVDVGRVVQAQIGVQAVAREAARACAAAITERDCLEAGLARAHQVAAGYGLATERLQTELDTGGFARDGWVTAEARQAVPVLWLGPQAALVMGAAAQHREPVEHFRSRPGARP